MGRVIVPHGYQDEASEAPFNYYASGKTGNALIEMPTGTGKSVVIADFCKKVFRRYSRQKIIIATHVKELVSQNYQKMMNIWPGAPAGINSAGLKQRDTVSPIIFAGIGSVVNYAEQFGPVDLVWVDECHRVGEEETSYINFINSLKAMNPALKVIGSTATPWRMGLGHLTEGDLFDDTCFSIIGLDPFARLLKEGYLCPLISKPTQTVLDTSGVHIRGGEFIAGELQRAIDRDEITQRACIEAADLGHDRKHWIAFCAGVEHAMHTADILNAMGIPSVAIHNKMSPTDRDNAIKAWQAGHYRCAVNNNILTTGIDFPGIDLMLILRPTMSSILWVQMLGRGTRCVYADGFDIGDYAQRMESIHLGGKNNCMVLDYSRNIERLGPINDPVIPRKKGDKPGDPPIRICECCDMYNHAAARYCGGKPKEHPEYNADLGCGVEFPRETKLNKEASTTQIIKGVDIPEIKTYKVDHITYSQHNKLGAPPSMRVSYYCGVKCFNEYVCLEHTNYASKRARIWWREHSDQPVPEKVADAISFSDQLKVATHLRVWVNKSDGYPQIMAYCFDGSEFGKLQASESYVPPTVEVQVPKLKSVEEVTDDDIPF